ncbi:hypothetical protein XAP7430_450003 [Xanthomonas phaseoli pv. phaseoli]|uniref:Secreted protein n=1 Tax=Xanthomonas campestris pv. phaseoli TaxID=317013 RepID=A0AB38E3C0_XANCH|nr:hypothetical protein XAP6984_480003 [Xanthomonas phaseoli pv. phaseoli]SON90144.1 hypothetical protein XAP7430_450003 [Xanthomonas phaseoli pv. phaseoli]
MIAPKPPFVILIIPLPESPTFIVPKIGWLLKKSLGTVLKIEDSPSIFTTPRPPSLSPSVNEPSVSNRNTPPFFMLTSPAP